MKSFNRVRTCQDFFKTDEIDKTLWDRVFLRKLKILLQTADIKEESISSFITPLKLDASGTDAKAKPPIIDGDKVLFFSHTPKKAFNINSAERRRILTLTEGINRTFLR